MANFADEVYALSGVRADECFQCGACTSACPVAAFMSPPPQRLVRMILAGRREEALTSDTLWFCTSCQACTAACPRGVDVARVIDAMRTLVVRRGRPAAEASIVAWHETFMEALRTSGRVNEAAVARRYLMRRGGLFSNLERALALFFKGRYPLRRKRLRDTRAVDAAFAAEDEAARGSRG